MNMRIFFLIIILTINVRSADTAVNNLKPHKISYELNGEKLEFTTYRQAKDKLDNKFHSHLRTLILLELYKKYHIEETNEAAIFETVYEYMSNDPQRKKLAQGAATLCDRLAKYIIIMHEQKVSAIDIYNSYIKISSEMPLEIWLDAACDYTYEWAKRYQGYDEKKKIASLFVVTNISLAKMVVLVETIASECPPERVKACIEKKLKSQIDELHLVLPPEYDHIRPELIQGLSKIANIIEFDRNNIPPVSNIIKYIQVQK